MIRPATPADGEPLAEIYNPYVLHTTVTFEEDAVSGGEMSRRVRNVDGAGLPWIVAEDRDAIVGYAYATPWRARSGYRFSVEVTVYVATGHHRRGYGFRLYAHLFRALQAQGLRAAIGGIVLPNPSSVALHERFGMAKVAHFEQVGRKLARWLDVGYWQLDLTRYGEEPNRS